MSLWFSQLPIELQHPREPGPIAVIDRVGPHRIVIACSLSAQEAGIRVGMQAPAALLKEPELKLLERSKSEERRALRAMADWALQFSSVVSLDVPRWLVWIEIGASLRYFEGLTALRTRIEPGVKELGYTALTGIAPTLEAAALFTRHSDVPAATTHADLESLVAPLPLSTLALDPRVTEQLHATGLTTVGELLAIPAAALARRFGPETTDYLQRLLGQRADPRRRHLAPDRYRRRYDFAEPIETLEGLLFPLRRVLQEMQGYLRGRDVAIQKVTITLRHRGFPDTLLTLHTSAPMRDAIRLFALTREKLERTPWKAAVTDLVISADEFHAPEIVQGDFFDDAQRRNAGWSALLDKLRARLGEQSVRHLGLVDDHRPEQAWCISSEPNDHANTESLPDRPFWLLEPIPITRPERLLGTPERIEAGWWDGADSARDYYLAISGEGARWWLYRDAASDRWYLHGLWA